MSRRGIGQEEYIILAKRGYEVVRLLGEGAFSRVLLVRERLEQRSFSEPGLSGKGQRISHEGERRGGQSRIPVRYLACKICNQEKLGLWEGRLLQQVDHPLFPRFFGMWQEGGKIFLLMEAVCGSSLGTILNRRGSFTQRQTARIGLELAAGLKYLHELPEPVLFRDVKPANILIRQDGRVKLLDLGCACSLRERPRDMAGTPGYGAPEQLKPGHMLTLACDVYGLGRTLQDMAGDGCGKAFYRVLQACTEPRPEERIPDMRGVMASLMPFEEECGRGRLSQKKGFVNPQVVCVRNIWESSYKNI